MDPNLTALLHDAADGNRDALDRLFHALYPDLRQVARSRLYAHGRAEDMGTTALVNESFIKLVDRQQLNVEDRQQFFVQAARTMRRVIIDELRSAKAAPGPATTDGAGPLTTARLAGDGELLLPAQAEPAEETLAVHEALGQLERLDPALAQVVEMRYFGGYTEVEIAGIIGVTERTVRRRWTKARAALYLALKGEPPEPGSED